MRKQTIVIAIILLLINLLLVQIVSATELSEKEVKFAAKVRSEVLKLGTGTEAKIELNLKDGKAIKGYVYQADEQNFTVIDSGNAANELPYTAVKKVRGKNKRIGIVVAATLIAILGTILVIAIVENAKCKSGTGPCS